MGVSAPVLLLFVRQSLPRLWLSVPVSDSPTYANFNRFYQKFPALWLLGDICSCFRLGILLLVVLGWQGL